MVDDIKIWVAIILASLTKWLLTEELPPDEETDRQKRLRLRRSVGGITAGVLLGAYGYEPVTRWAGFGHPSDAALVAILLAFTGEHVFRALIEKAPKIIDAIIARKTGVGKGDDD